MPYFTLTYEVVDDFVNQRAPFRPWTVVIGNDPAETPPGLPT